jgi:hypothetical protein
MHISRIAQFDWAISLKFTKIAGNICFSNYIIQFHLIKSNFVFVPIGSLDTLLWAYLIVLG